MASTEPKQHEILFRIADAGVEAIVVGMTAGVILGVPMTTWDLDIVHRRTPENGERLLRVLEDVGAVARHDLVGASLVVDFEGRPLRVLDLSELLAIKTRAGRAKDLASIPIIRATIDEIARRGSRGG